MEITVGCHCGSNYCFDETPVNGRLQSPVTCPNCGTDGTNLANEYIRKFVSGELEREQERSKPWWQRLFGRSRAAGDAAAAEKEFRFSFGVAGALIGAAAGFAAWYCIKRWTGFELGLVAWGIGGLVGFCARFAAGGGSFGLAGVASAAAVVSIMGGQYWSLHQVVDGRIKIAAGVIYNSMHDYAENAENAVTDEKISKLLHDYAFRPSDLAPGENSPLCQKRLMTLMGLAFKNVMKEGSAPSLRQAVDEKLHQPKITPADIAAFRQRELPDLRQFLNGKPAEAEFTDALAAMTRKNLSFNQMMMQSWSRYTLLWIFLGVITAYRLAYDRSEVESF
jgi:hypothetical protein